MNEYNNESNRGPVTPYKASGNLNTAIGNPQVNINDTMNVNIQSMATNNVFVPNTPNIVEEVQKQSSITNTNVPINNSSVENIVNTLNINNVQSSNIKQNIAQIEKQKDRPVNTNQNINNNNTEIQRTYVTMNNKPKKKTLSFSLGPEFKIGLLIIVILLVFVLFLPMISDFFNGY